MTVDLEALASETLSWMTAQSAGTEAEIYLERTHVRTLSRREGFREGCEIADGLGAGVRVLRDGKVGFATAGGADLTTLKRLWTQAVGQLSTVAAEPGRRLPAAAAPNTPASLETSLRDESLFTRSWDELEQSLLGSEEAAAAQGQARIVRSDVRETREESVIANSHGLFAHQRGDFVAASVSSAAEDGGEMQVGEGWRGARRFDAVDWTGAGAEAARRALAIIGARRIRPGRATVVFAPWVGVEFLEVIAELLSAQEVESGRSLLGGRQGRSVASPLLTLSDDPHLLSGWGSCAFDGEGVATRSKTLIDRGVLREFLYDSATAARAGVEPNGCGHREAFDSLPRPGVSNLFIAPGSGSADELISKTGDGLFVYEVLGIHMIDPVSGEFSVGISGQVLNRGALGPPFKSAMISGNLLDLLGRIDAVADDLAFYGGLGAPTFRVAELDAS